MVESSSLDLLAIAVGNTRTRIGLFRAGHLHDPSSVPNDPIDAIVERAAQQASLEPDAPIVMASVNDRTADEIEAALSRKLAREVMRFGRDLGFPVTHSLADGSTIGQDRLLCAIGAYAQAAQACIVIDAGTAITVDFVDGQGVFHGGAIAPGVTMMLRALHEHTAALPEVAFDAPPPSDGGPFGQSTRDAMLRGAVAAARGLASELCQSYAESYGAYPQIIATGGDATALFDGGGLVEHIVPDLQLIGIHAACRKLLLEDAEDDAPRPAEG